MSRLLLMILMILAAAAMVAFAIANRTLVTVSFDPFDPTDPAFVATMPLYVLAFAILILGAIVGGLATSKQGKRRREHREMRGPPSPQGASPHATLAVPRLPAN
jgi:hypothetical protein